MEQNWYMKFQITKKNVHAREGIKKRDASENYSVASDFKKAVEEGRPYRGGTQQ